MARPTDNLKVGWDFIRKSGIIIDPPTPSDHYLGCGPSAWTAPDDVFNKRMSTIRPHLPKYNNRFHKPASNVRGIRHDMLGFTDQCIARYLECVSQLTTKTGSRRKRTPQVRRRSPSPASTPRYSSHSEDVFFPTSRSKTTVGRSASPSAERPTHDTGITYDDLPHADTPGIEDTASSEKDLSDPGVLGPDAASVLMKIMYLARCCRYDVLYPVCMLAREITKWTCASDRRLHRFICYLKSTRTHCLHGWIGDPAEHLPLMMFTDASFADCVNTSRCTTGARHVLAAERRVQEADRGLTFFYGIPRSWPWTRLCAWKVYRCFPCGRRLLAPPDLLVRPRPWLPRRSVARRLPGRRLRHELRHQVGLAPYVPRLLLRHRLLLYYILRRCYPTCTGP